MGEDRGSPGFLTVNFFQANHFYEVSKLLSHPSSWGPSTGISGGPALRLQAVLRVKAHLDASLVFNLTSLNRGSLSILQVAFGHSVFSRDSPVTSLQSHWLLHCGKQFSSRIQLCNQSRVCEIITPIYIGSLKFEHTMYYKEICPKKVGKIMHVKVYLLPKIDPFPLLLHDSYFFQNY